MATNKDLINNTDEETATSSNAKPNSFTLNNLHDIEKAIEMLNLIPSGSVKSTEAAKKKTYQFWQTQPVPRFGNFYFNCQLLMKRNMR